MQLSAAQTKYLRAIYELTLESEDGTTVSAVATAAAVTRATASVTIKWLEKHLLVSRPARSCVLLTRSGMQQAVLSYGKQNILYAFFTKVLQVPADVAMEDATAMEMLLSEETLCAMCKASRTGPCARCGNFQACGR